MNTLTIAGRIGKQPEMRSLQDGTHVLSFSVADDQGRDKQTIWWNCALFGKRAEALQQYLNKGGHVTVSGRVTQREYTDKTGQQRRAFDVRVNDISLQGGKPGHSTAQDQTPYRATKAPEAGDPFGDMESDVPFN